MDFPIPGYCWAPERIFGYNYLVAKMKAYAVSGGPKPTDEDLRLWAMVAPREAEDVWDGWCSNAGAACDEPALTLSENA